MKLARIRLVIAAVLLCGWLGYLGYLVLFERHPVVVSRSQVMSSTHFVLAEVTVDPQTGLPDRQVKVVEDLRPLGTSLTGQTIDVRNIREARIAGGAEGFQKPGPYLLMLTRADDLYQLTPPPISPGQDRAVRPWAYLWEAPGVQDQFEALVPRRPGEPGASP